MNSALRHQVHGAISKVVDHLSPSARRALSSELEWLNGLFYRGNDGRASSWTEERKATHAVAVSRLFREKRVRALFHVVFEEDGDSKIVVGWDHLVKITRLKEGSLRSGFSTSANVIFREARGYRFKVIRSDELAEEGVSTSPRHEWPRGFLPIGFDPSAETVA